MIIDIKTLTKVQFNQLIELVKLYFAEIENEILDDDSAASYLYNVEKQLEKHQTLHFFVSEDNGSEYLSHEMSFENMFDLIYLSPDAEPNE